MESTLESHKSLYEMLTDEISTAYQIAREQGRQDPVVVVVHLRDPFADMLAVMRGPEAEREQAEQIEEMESLGMEPLKFVGYEREDAKRFLGGFPGIAEKLSRRREGVYSTVIIAAGEASVWETELP